MGEIGGCVKLGYIFSKKQYNNRSRGKTIFIICLELQRGQVRKYINKESNYVKREITGGSLKLKKN